MKTTTSFAGLLAVSALTLAGITGADTDAPGKNGHISGKPGIHAGAGAGNSAQNS